MKPEKNGFFYKKITLRWYWTLVLLVLLALLATGVSVMIQPGSVFSTARNFLRQPVLILLNALPSLVFIGILYALIGNVFYAGAVNTVAAAVLSLVNLIKIECRNDPFVPGDITSIREAFQATGEYQLNLHPPLLAAVAVLTVLLVLAGIKFKSARPKVLWRCVLGVAAAGVFALSMFTLYNNSELYTGCILKSGTYVNQYNIPTVFDGLGFPYCFLRNVSLYNMEKPDGYSRSEAAQWAQDSAESATLSVTPNVVFVQCEAFSDIFSDAVFGYSETENPLYLYRQLAEDAHTISGHIVVSNYGAGTANTEFDILTGMPTTMIGARASALRSFHKNTSSLARVFSDAGYSTYFMHPGDRWFYNRESAYSFLGMQEQVYKDVFSETDYKGTMVSDEAFKDRLLADLAARDDAPLFAFAVSIQNHQAYPYSKYPYQVEAAPLLREVSDETEETISVYAEGIRDSARMLDALAQTLNESDTPTLLVFWGDHLPAMGSNFSVYHELGLNIGYDTDAQSTINTYTTPFLIWANDAYCEQVDFDAAVQALALPQENLISDFYLGSLVYELLGLENSDAYFDFLTQARRSLPVIHLPYCRTADGSYTDTPDAAQQALLDKLHKWEYYRITDETVR